MIENYRIPRRLWNWRLTALLACLTPMPVLFVLALAPDMRDVASMTAIRSLVGYGLLLIAGIACYVFHKVSTETSAGWIAVALMGLGLCGVTAASLGTAHLGSPFPDSAALELSRLLQAAGLALIGLAAVRCAHLAVDPLALAVGGATVLLGVRAFPTDLGIGLTPSPVQVLTVEAVRVLLLLVCAWGVAHTHAVPAWTRNRLALALVLVAVASCATTTALRWDGDHRGLATAGAAAFLVAVPVTLSTTFALVRGAVLAERAAFVELTQRYEAADAEVRVGRARLHEIDATVAGIASASAVLRKARGAAYPHRSALERMVQAEVERLRRLVAAHQDRGLTAVDLDAVVAPLVTSHRARGRTVLWTPSGVHSTTRPDAVAEVVNILLENAGRHAEGSPVVVSAEQRDELVVVVVSDRGPGVAPEDRDAVFEWEVRGARSAGQGIGLNVARQLARQLGGDVVLRESEVGATFVFTTPYAPVQTTAAVSTRHEEILSPASVPLESAHASGTGPS